MATTVRQLFNKFNIPDFQKIKWGTPFNEMKQGVYIVSISNNPEKHLSITDQPSFDENQIKLWISKLPNFLVDHSWIGKCCGAIGSIKTL